MKNAASEAFWDRMKSVAVCCAVAIVGIIIVLRDPRTQAQFYTLQHLSPGKVAPDIVGTDCEGRP